MGRGLWWCFGEPREEAGKLATDFYFQIGRHTKLCLPWPSKPFTGAGGLSFQVDNGEQSLDWLGDLTAKTEESGRRLYELLGKEAQATLIQTFANSVEEDEDRILYLLFPTPTPKNREICLTLEDLPWELLHDGEEFITWRYRLQIVRSHPREIFASPPRKIEVSSWGVLLVTPFVFAEPEHLARAGLAALPYGVEEVKILRQLQRQTHGLIRIAPLTCRTYPGGITTLRELENDLSSVHTGAVHCIHFVGHGVIYDDEPCLCFESGSGGIDYVSVSRLRKVFLAARDASRHESPSVLFINACSSSSRGRYSSGFASGLHDLGMCVLGYHADIYDDNKPQMAAESFYRSLCLDQSLRTPQTPPNVITAIGVARRRLRNVSEDAQPVWGSLRAYLPAEISYSVRGRGLFERGVQKLYSHFSQWMNPRDYTDHLSIGFQFALLFGALMGIFNLTLVFPESVLTRHFTYQEIVSEITRIFLVGPLSFLAAALFVAYQTLRNHQFLTRQTRQVSLWRLAWHCLSSLPVYVLTGASFSAMFVYSFSRLDLLTAQITAFTSMIQVSIAVFWYSLVGVLGGALALSLLISNWFCLWRKETLHSYRTFYVVAFLYLLIGGVLGFNLLYGISGGVERAAGWLVFVLLNLVSYPLAVTKIMKEITWRALQKSGPAAQLSWRKLAPLLGTVVLVIICYYLLEESVRFEAQTIQSALLIRKDNYEENHVDPQVENIIERALRQRAIREIPDSIKDIAKEDWLLGVVCADYFLYRSRTRDDEQERLKDLRDSKSYLDESDFRNREVEFKDYYNNIYSMVDFMLADHDTNLQDQRRGYENARYKAACAVEKDKRNFAYLDTLARAESRLGELDGDLSLLRSAADHIREAQWRAFFLRSSRAREVRQSIDAMAKIIQDQIARVRDNNPAIPQRFYP